MPGEELFVESMDEHPRIHEWFMVFEDV